MAWSGFRRTGSGAQGFIRKVLHAVTDIILVVILALFFVEYIFTAHTVRGHSMEPFYRNGDILLCDSLTFHVLKPGRFDVILFEKENQQGQIYMKRVTGLPGETVLIKDGIIYIDGEPLKDSHVSGDVQLAGIAEKEILLGKDEYFVMGDNPESSGDSRFSSTGNVKISEIKGRIWLRVSPLSSIGPVR